MLLFGALILSFPSQAATFSCEGSTVVDSDIYGFDLDDQTCDPSFSSGPDEIAIGVNIDASNISVVILMYNGASATITGADAGNGSVSSGSSINPTCSNAGAGCTISISGTFSSAPYNIDIVFPGSGTLSGTIQNTSGGSAPEISVSETGQGQGAVADGGTLA